MEICLLVRKSLQNRYSEEYFKRDTRRVPVWKSEAEFRSLFDASERKDISDAMRWIVTIFGPEFNAEVNEETLARLEEKLSNRPGNSIYKNMRDLVAAILDLCGKHGIQRDVLILSASAFTSNFSMEKVKELLIVFPGLTPRRLKEVSTTLSSDGPEEEKLYYFFYYPKCGREKVDTPNFAKELAAIFRAYKTPT